MSERRAYAFFDVDGTLLSLKSMFSFQDFFYRRSCGGPTGPLGALRSRLFSARFALYERTGRDRAYVNRAFYRTFRGRVPAQVQALAERWYGEVRQRPEVLIGSAMTAVRTRQAEGCGIVLVSGSLDLILAPLARELGVSHCLATQLEVRHGRYTGEIAGTQMIGPGKAVAIRAFLAQTGADPAQCFAYGDHHSDIPMLATVGHPVAVIGDSVLAAHASRQRWEVLRLADSTP